MSNRNICNIVAMHYMYKKNIIFHSISVIKLYCLDNKTFKYLLFHCELHGYVVVHACTH